jgi:hypothetical protein
MNTHGNGLVKIGSCLDVARADLAQAALARERLFVALENANFLSWFWHWSNAVGGVKILVRNDQADLARQVLAAARARSTDSLPPWVCPSCGQRVGGQWTACWQCGQGADGTPSSPAATGVAQPAASETQAGPRMSLSSLFVAVTGIVLVVLLLKSGPSLPLVLAPFVILLGVLLRQFEPSADRQSESQESPEPMDGPSEHLMTTRSEISRAIVRRAWQASVIATLVFPPLGFYSMRLLWKLGQRNTPLGCADRWRSGMAFLFSAAAIGFCMSFAGAILLEFSGRWFGGLMAESLNRSSGVILLLDFLDHVW